MSNQKLSTEFDLYLAEHPEIEDQIPDNALIVLLPEYDKELSEKNIELAKRHREPGQPVVYVRIEKVNISRLEGFDYKWHNEVHLGTTSGEMCSRF